MNKTIFTSGGVPKSLNAQTKVIQLLIYIWTFIIYYYLESDMFICMSFQRSVAWVYEWNQSLPIQIYNIDIFGMQSHQPEATWWDLNCFEIDSTLELSVNISLYGGGLWWISDYLGEVMLTQTDRNWQQLKIWWRFYCSAAVGACTAAWQNITEHLNKKNKCHPVSL